MGAFDAVTDLKVPSELKWFSQLPFHNANNTDGLAANGLIYIPQSCSGNTKCDVHLNFHGCGFVTDAVFVMLASVLSFNDWADSNNIIVIYPRSRYLEDRNNGASQATLTSDQKSGCWNVYGKSGHDYAQRTSPQMMAIHNMIVEAQTSTPQMGEHLQNYDTGKFDIADALDEFGFDSSWFGQTEADGARAGYLGAWRIV